MAGTVRVSRIQMEVGAQTATVRVAQIRLATGPAAVASPAVIRVARLRFVTGTPQTVNAQAYRWDGAALVPVRVGYWTGSAVEYLTP